MSNGRREDILLILKSHGPATLGQVAESLGISKQGALRHLDSLEEDGLVGRGPGEHLGRGRPEHVYALAEAADSHFPQAHRGLAKDLVEFMTQEQLQDFFQERARRLEAEYAPKLLGLSFEERARELARLASENGHMAELVEGEDGTLAIRHHNCPIADVAALTGHPCQAEMSMYERLLGAPVERTTWLPDRAPGCTYEIKNSKG